VYGSTSLSLSGKNDVSTSGFFPGFFFFSGTTNRKKNQKSEDKREKSMLGFIINPCFQPNG